MNRSVLIALLIVVADAAASVTCLLAHRADDTRDLALFGNVDLRQGQVLARLDRSRLEPQVAQFEAQAAAQRQVVQRLRNGSRPEEIEQARANVESAKADVANAHQQYERLKAAA